MKEFQGYGVQNFGSMQVVKDWLDFAIFLNYLKSEQEVKK